MLRSRLSPPATLVLAALLASALLASCASRAPKPAGAQHRGRGVVVAINAEKGRVKIEHEAIENYMDAMTMWFDVKDKKLLDGLSPNDKIEFVLTEDDAADVVTEITKVG